MQAKHLEEEMIVRQSEYEQQIVSSLSHPVLTDSVFSGALVLDM